jgi:tRNA threonylcarbamoyladenosine biosynthesis protein TsaB
VSGPLILAIESATARVGCAMGTVEEIRASTFSARPRRHAESLIPQIRFVADQAGAAIDDIEVVAVDVGPGLYTGLRVGISTARAMAHTLGVPMIAVTSLETIARGARCDDDLVVAIDARRGEVFHSTFLAVDGHLSSGSEPAVSTPEALAETLAARAPIRVVGDGAIAHSAVFTARGLAVGDVETAFPSPDDVLRVAAARPNSVVPPTAVEPLYLRRPDAVAKWEGV